MQESVGATAARACIMALRIYKTLGLKTRLMACLYDSMVSIGPIEERELVARIHALTMSTLNTWNYNDAYGNRVLQYKIENDLNKAWSTKPPKELKEKLYDFSWRPLPDSLRFWNDDARLTMIVS